MTQPPANPSLATGPTPRPEPPATPKPTEAASTELPSPPGPQPLAATLPVRGSAWETGREIVLAPGLDGMSYVSIPAADDAVVVLLDADGRPRPGWPIAVPHSTRCFIQGVADDGSVRAICDATDIQQPDWCCDTLRAFAFDPVGRLMRGWPVDVISPESARVIGDQLVVLSTQAFTDTVTTGVASHRSRLVTIAADGAVRSGAEVPMLETMGTDTWAIGPDGVAYGTESVGEWSDETPTGKEASRVVAFDAAGPRAGWPVTIDGVASGPAFASDGRILVAVGVFDVPRSWIVALEPAGKGTAVSSATLPLMSALQPGGLQCNGYFPIPPLADERTVVTSDWVSTSEPTWYALDPALEVLPGWPYKSSQALQWTGPPAEPGDVDCVLGPPAEPALASDGTLYLALAPGSDATGGSLVAVGRDGAVVPGWPVRLQRAGSGFWSAVVGTDGTVFALAVEPEAGRKSSATILGIAPDGTVRWNTTVIEP
ncbi:MAG: hypothetical protein OEX05_05340 [Chloroflexota bacterium]|nr:hypothetical protein [Chloroflexota bacterium]